MDVKTIGIIGGGTIGRATARAFLEWADVKVYDVIASQATHTYQEVMSCDLVFVCLPTPSKHGKLDLSILHRFFEAIPNKYTNFVLKSTVPVGTTNLLRHKYDLRSIVHSPEFLTARCAFTDAQIPSRNIIGGVESDCFRKLADLYYKRFCGVTLYTMSSDESELVKLMINAFFAVKISFFNELHTLCASRGLEWNKVLGGVLSDGRISHSHYRVPGPDGRYGFGGACLPKDLQQLVADLGEEACITKAAVERNKTDRGTND